MFEHIFNSLSTFNSILIYTVLLVIPFVENVFPPSPSDLIVVLGGSLITKGTIHFFPALLFSSVGSEIGFLLLYYLGKQTDKKIIQKGKFKFLSSDALKIAENWFQKYGFIIILFNRFIPGVRSVIAYFSGISELNFKKTLTLSSISALLWHLLLLLLGIWFGENISKVDYYLNTYTNVILIIFILIIIYFVVNYFLKKKKSAS